MKPININLDLSDFVARKLTIDGDIDYKSNSDKERKVVKVIVDSYYNIKESHVNKLKEAVDFNVSEVEFTVKDDKVMVILKGEWYE